MANLSFLVTAVRYQCIICESNVMVINGLRFYTDAVDSVNTDVYYIQVCILCIGALDI